MKCKFYSEEIGKCLFDWPPDDCPFDDNKNNCTCFEPIKENKDEFKNMKKCKFYAETARRGWCSNVDCLLERCYFDDNLNSCELFDPIKCEKESSPSALKCDKVETVKLMPDNGRPIDKRILTIKNCDKIILKPKSLEVEVIIEKDNFDDFDFIIINGRRFEVVK